MTAVERRATMAFIGRAAPSMSARRVICSVYRLPSTLMALIATLVLVAGLGTQALAHEGHDATTAASAPVVDAAASDGRAAPSGEVLIVTPDADECDGHCCVSSLCCPAVVLALDVSAAPPHAAAAAAASAADLLATSPPEGPRRPPRTRL